MVLRALASIGAAGLVLAASAIASADPVPMTPDATPMTPDEPSSESSSPTRRTLTRAAPPVEGDNGANAFLIAGAVPFIAGAIQVPLGVGMAKANDGGGVAVAGVVLVVSGVIGVGVGVPLLVIGTRRRARVGAPQEEEYALRVGPRGLSFRGSF